MMSDAAAVEAKAQALLERGASLYEAGKLYEALACWKRVLEIDPGNDIATEYLRFIEDNFQIGVDAFLAHHESGSAPPSSMGPGARMSSPVPAAAAPDVPDPEPLGDLDWSELLDDPDAAAVAPPDPSLAEAEADDDDDFFAVLEPGSMEAVPGEEADAWGAAAPADAAPADASLAEEMLVDPFQLPASAFSTPFDPLSAPPLASAPLSGTDPPLVLTDLNRGMLRSQPPVSFDLSDVGSAPPLSAEGTPFDFEGAADWPDLDAAIQAATSQARGFEGESADEPSLADGSLPFALPNADRTILDRPAPRTGSGLPSSRPVGRSSSPPLGRAPTTPPVRRASVPSISGVSGSGLASGVRSPLPSGRASSRPPAADRSMGGDLGEREITVMSDDSIELMLDNDFKPWETGSEPDASPLADSVGPGLAGPDSAPAAALSSERPYEPPSSRRENARSGEDIFSSPFDQATPPPRPAQHDDLEDWSALMGHQPSEQPADRSSRPFADHDDVDDMVELEPLAPDPLPFDGTGGSEAPAAIEDDEFDFDAAFEALEAGTAQAPVTLPANIAQSTRGAPLSAPPLRAVPVATPVPPPPPAAVARPEAPRPPPPPPRAVEPPAKPAHAEALPRAVQPPPVAAQALAPEIRGEQPPTSTPPMAARRVPTAHPRASTPSTPPAQPTSNAARELEALLRAGMAEIDAIEATPRPGSLSSGSLSGGSLSGGGSLAGGQRAEAPVTEADFDALMREARRRQQAGDFSGSLELVEQVLNGQPDHREARVYMEENTTRLLAMYRSRLGRLGKVPTVRLRPQEIIWQSLDHRAGFVLAQVDGLTSYEDIVEISGMSELESTRILARLVEHGVIG